MQGVLPDSDGATEERSQAVPIRRIVHPSKDMVGSSSGGGGGGGGGGGTHELMYAKVTCQKRLHAPQPQISKHNAPTTQKAHTYLLPRDFGRCHVGLKQLLKGGLFLCKYPSDTGTRRA